MKCEALYNARLFSSEFVNINKNKGDAEACLQPCHIAWVRRGHPEASLPSQNTVQVEDGIQRRTSHHAAHGVGWERYPEVHLPPSHRRR